MRNYQVRNFRRHMQLGNGVFFHYSNCAKPGISGIMHGVREACPNPTQFEQYDSHYDPRSTREAPRWSAVDLEFIEQLDTTAALSKL